MLETIATFITDWTYRQYRRFGYWVYAPPAIVVLLMGVMFLWSSWGANEKRMHGGMTEEEWNLLLAGNAQEAESEAQQSTALNEKKAAAAKAAAEARAKAAAAAAPKPVPPVSAEPEAKSKPSAAAPPGSLPANLAEWKKDDFLRARADGDPRLADALVALGRRTAGNAATPAFLMSWLANPPPAPATPPGVPAKPAKPLAGSIVAALMANGTYAARAALREIVGGKVATLDDPAALTAAIDFLAASDDGDDEELLLRALVAPSELRPPWLDAVDPRATSGSGNRGSTAEDLQKKVAAAVRASGSESIRIRLAKHLVHPDTSPAVRQRLVDCLLDVRCENIPAQTLVYGCEELDPKVRDVLEQRFTAWSAEALARALGLPATQSTAATAPLSAAGAASATVQAVDPASAVPVLWTKEFVKNVARRLSLAESLKQAERPLKLAGVLPSAASRAAIRESLEKHLYETSATVDYASPYFTTVTDPGLVLVLKGLPRKGLAAQRPSAPARRGTRAGAPGATATPARTNTAELIKQQHASAEEWWIQRSEILVENWCARLRRAALADAVSRSASEETLSGLSNVSGCDLLRPNARLTAVYHCPWPGRLKAKVPQAASDAAEVYYVRMEEKARPDLVVADYRRAVATAGSTATLRATARGLWMDVFGDADDRDDESTRGSGKGNSPVLARAKTGTVPMGRKRSIDVLISKAVQDAPALRQEDMDLVIEILVIEGS
jgi:hypothetical protein